MRLTLYYAPIACSLVPLVTLHESGAQFEVKPISLKNGQHKTSEYMRINPKSKVPVLVVDGEALTENVAILTWLASAFPTAKLLPTNPKNAIRALSLMAWCASGLHPPLTRIFDPARYCSVPGSEESIRKLALEEVIKNFKIVIPPFPNYAAHGERMMKRESAKRALAFEREVLAQAAKAACNPTICRAT